MTERRRGRARKRPAVVSEPTSRRLLLDTHVWLWWQAGDRRLGTRCRRTIASAAEVRLSAASVWEIAIKSSIGKLSLPPDADIERELAEDGFLPLPIELAHAEAMRRLSQLHRDPFDRMLVAQSRVEGLALVTADPELAAYRIELIDATE